MSLSIGDPFPSLRAPGNSNPNYVLDSTAGRYLVIAILTGGDRAQFDRAQALVAGFRRHFDDEKISFFGVIDHDAAWRSEGRDSVPGVRWLFDSGALADLQAGKGAPGWVLVDPAFRVMGVADLDRGQALLATLDRLPDVEAHGGAPVSAPVLSLPRIFEPAFCAALIAHYETVGGKASGFMREIDGVTRVVHDDGHKRRKDVTLEPGPMTQAVQGRIARRLVPQIAKAFQFEATRIERYLIAAYEAEDGGFFRPHRDNTTRGTAHRRFAVSINLNDDFDGGDLRFPEFGSRTYRPSVGGAVVFSCSLLHEATQVTRGRRYAFLPFLYDDAAARIRAENAKYVAPEHG